MAYIPAHMPTKEEILERATSMYMMDLARTGMPAITPEEDELKEESYWDRARNDLMAGTRSMLEEGLAHLESEAESIRDELGIKPAPPPKAVRELEEQLDSVTTRLRITRTRLKEARETIEKLREIKIPPKVIAAPPPEKTVCPAHKAELTPIIGRHDFPWGLVTVPAEMFLFQCPMEWEYYVCEPRKACELVSLDKLKLRLVRIIKPIAPPRVPVRERERIVEAAELEPNFNDFLREVGIGMEEYKRLDRLAQFVMRSEYRRWKKAPY